MSGYGNEETIMSANRNLWIIIEDIPQSDKEEALCYTTDYLLAYIQKHGNINGIPKELIASHERKIFKDLDWCLPDEIAPYECKKET